MNKRHIFLTGFMGSGKSTLGKKLATLLHLNFVDLDHYIEQHEKKTIAFIFNYEGEPTFREMETNCLIELTQLNEPCVIALGGGTVCFNNNLALVKNSGLLIYIEHSAEVLAQRLRNSRQKRPLLKKIKDEELIPYINEKLEERNVFYKQASIIVNGLKLSPQILQQHILDFKKKHNPY